MNIYIADCIPIREAVVYTGLAAAILVVLQFFQFITGNWGTWKATAELNSQISKLKAELVRLDKLVIESTYRRPTENDILSLDTRLRHLREDMKNLESLVHRLSKPPSEQVAKLLDELKQLQDDEKQALKDRLPKGLG